MNIFALRKTRSHTSKFYLTFRYKYLQYANQAARKLYPKGHFLVIIGKVIHNNKKNNNIITIHNNKKK